MCVCVCVCVCVSACLVGTPSWCCLCVVFVWVVLVCLRASQLQHSRQLVALFFAATPTSKAHRGKRPICFSTAFFVVLSWHSIKRDVDIAVCHVLFPQTSTDRMSAEPAANGGNGGGAAAGPAAATPEDAARPLILQDVLFPPVLQVKVTETYDFELIANATPEQLESAEGIISVLHSPINDEIFQKMPNLRVVSNFGAGYDHVDVPAAEARGIVCGHTPGVRMCGQKDNLFQTHVASSTYACSVVGLTT